MSLTLQENEHPLLTKTHLLDLLPGRNHRGFRPGIWLIVANIIPSVVLAIVVLNHFRPEDEIDWLDVLFEGGVAAIPLFMYAVVAFVVISYKIKAPLLVGCFLTQSGRNFNFLNEFVVIRFEHWSAIGDGLALTGELMIAYAATVWIIRSYRLAVTDRLTHLYNRHYLEKSFDRLTFLSGRQVPKLAFIMLDIDNFKQVNDRYGHVTGDEVLKVIAQILRDNTRQGDIVARQGGEEFEILLPDTTFETAKVYAERIRSATENYHQEGIPRFTASFGISIYAPGDDIRQLRIRADEAVYRAKRQGKNCIAYETGQN